MKSKIYSMKELAGLYFPNSTGRAPAVQLKRWMKLNTELMEELHKAGYRNGQKMFTPRQVQLIFRHIGEP